MTNILLNKNALDKKYWKKMAIFKINIQVDLSFFLFFYFTNNQDSEE